MLTAEKIKNIEKELAELRRPDKHMVLDSVRKWKTEQIRRREAMLASYKRIFNGAINDNSRANQS